MYLHYYFCSHSLQNMNRAYMNIKIYTFEYLKLPWSSSHELLLIYNPMFESKPMRKCFFEEGLGCRPCADNG